MTMSNEEIIRDYNQASNKSKQIRILADLNCCSPGEIRKVLAQAGVHKAVMGINSATEEQKARSAGWLIEHGFKPWIGGAP